jgi:lauroyl/myristoyl acyltransferase
LIRWFCGTSYARNDYFKRKVRLINTFLEETKIKESSPELIHKMLNAFFLKKWCIMAISNLSEKKFKKYVRIQGLDIFRENYEKGNGVIILSSHFGFPEVSISLFPRIGFTDFYTVVGSRGAESEKFTGINPNIESKTLTFDNFSDMELIKLLMKAKHILKEGGIIHLLGDGYHGKSSLTFPFIGKLRGFRGSYAELALSTDAQIIPVFITPGNRGHLTVDLRKPLDKGTEEQSREERITHITRQYVEQLAEEWKKSPQFVNWGHMEKYLHHIDKE